MLIAMHYVRTLCDTYFLSYDGFLNCPWQKMKKNPVNMHREKVFGKPWISIHICFPVCKSTMHYVRTLCDKYFHDLWWLLKNEKKTSICTREEVFDKGLKICTYRFLGMLIAMHYVRTLYDKYCVEVLWYLLDFWQEGLGIGFWNLV